MTSAQIRQSFLDFFREKQHAIVPSSSLLPDSPNLLFTNAGMNQFVPIFLGETPCPYSPGRAADTQKCIRAGGKHNDLDDVGLDTYHHTFFEMLGNWSFGDYFKKEAIAWAWELVVERWGFPANRLYATVYSPDKSKGDPADFDQEAHDFWAALFEKAGLDPKVHIVNGNKKDNFWMMGDTGPCGPCSELHVSLLPELDEAAGRELVNSGDPRCIEIWNLVFIEFNASIKHEFTDLDFENPKGPTSYDVSQTVFQPLPSKHVDTGMGFERVASIIQCTKNFTSFGGTTISNYETDIFRPIFDEIEKLSGKKYTSTLPRAGSTGESEQEKTDIAFRVIADHIRTLSFAIADGIAPGNTDRNYVLRRILRRAVRYGRTLGFHEPFFYKLVPVLAKTMGDVFPEIHAKQAHIEEVLKREEEAFNKTLDRGIGLHSNISSALDVLHGFMLGSENGADVRGWAGKNPSFYEVVSGLLVTVSPNEFGSSSTDMLPKQLSHIRDNLSMRAHALNWLEKFPAQYAFELYDTYGFPLDLTELMARERGLTVDTAGFEIEMEKQRARARAAQKKTVIELSQIETKTPTQFLGYELLRTEAEVQEVVALKDKTAVILNNSVLYAEMGGQVGDTGEITSPVGKLWRVSNTQKSGHAWLHFIEGSGDGDDAPEIGEHVSVSYDAARRAAIQRHHSVTHVLHWALHEVVSREATQKGSFVGPEKLTFDFNSAALTPAQVRDVERLVNERIVENAAVRWSEVPYAEVRGRADVMQFFGDKYGDTVRLVEIGDYSKELCGGTHARATGEIGLFRIVSEGAVAAGVRRIEAVAGLPAYDFAHTESARLRAVAAKLGAPLGEIEKKLEAMLSQQKELEKQLKALGQKQAAETARGLVAKAETLGGGVPAILENLGAAGGDELQAVADALKSLGFKGAAVLAGTGENGVALVATVSAEFTAKIQAGKIIQAIAPIVGGKGGGRPDSARGAGKDAGRIPDALAAAKNLLG